MVFLPGIKTLSFSVLASVGLQEIDCFVFNVFLRTVSECYLPCADKEWEAGPIGAGVAAAVASLPPAGHCSVLGMCRARLGSSFFSRIYYF